ncbi:uncharacterized protein [Epargyreus clarus]|uniref:uncharacterized protein n=1 Tax=Epargyreus clarus TaxID=520877 RepID=UPI003C2AD05F
MNKPEIKSYEEQAIDAVTSILNRAKESLGDRQTLKQLAGTRDSLAPPAKVLLSTLGAPLAITSEHLIKDTIERTWHLTDTFKYILKYMGGSQDECSQHYYYEAIFSQPTEKYPIPQATVSVFFRVEEKYMETSEIKGVPVMTYTIEGQHGQHDVRYVLLSADSILATLKMKLKFFKRIEDIRLF